MAYDKMVDSAALDGDLKTVANAIRSKGGTTANLAFPAGFANAIEAIKTGGNMEYHEITLASDRNTEGTLTLLSGNAFVKANYAKDAFFVVMRTKTPITNKLAYGLLEIYHGNRTLASGINASYGNHMLFNSGASGLANANNSYKVNGTTWNLGFRASSAGNLLLYTPASRPIAAGTYELFLVCEE